MKKVGLYFGTFNPVHNGHLALGNYFLQHSSLDEVRFIVSPQNPFKKDLELEAAHHRLEMVRLAITEFSNLTLSDVEFSFPQPSYTITTLEYLCEKEPEVRFVLLMGADNLAFFDRWKEHQKIVSLVDLYVYPREHKNEIPAQYLDHLNIHFVDAPKLDYTATSIRKILRQGKDVKSLLPMTILNYIQRNALYH